MPITDRLPGKGPHPDRDQLVVLVAVLAALSVLLLVLGGCTTGDGRPESRRDLVLIPDRTGVAQSDTWSAEVISQVRSTLEAPANAGADRVHVLAIGSNTDQTALAAMADLTAIEGNTRAKRREVRERLIEDVASAAGQVASVPVDTYGTDVFAALHQAASLCQAPEVEDCSLLVLSDLEDQRVLAAASPEAAVEDLADLMPDLTGVAVQVSGLGASGVDVATVERVRTAWTGLLSEAGAVDVRIARSL